MRTVIAEPLTADAFHGFGDVLEAPTSPGRTYFDEGLASNRPHAVPSLSLAHIAPVPNMPLLVTKMERHEHSSQSFVPMGPARFIVIVAPAATSGGPDMARARAFIADGGQGVTYGLGVWHHPMTVLDRAARFTVVMWRDGGPGDEEFVDVTEPFNVAVA